MVRVLLLPVAQQILGKNKEQQPSIQLLLKTSWQIWPKIEVQLLPLTSEGSPNWQLPCSASNPLLAYFKAARGTNTLLTLFGWEEKPKIAPLAATTRSPDTNSPNAITPIFQEMNQSKVGTPKAAYFIPTLIIPMTPKPLLQSLAAAGSPQRHFGEPYGVAQLNSTTPGQVQDEEFLNFLFFYSERELFFFLTRKIFFQDTIQERERIFFWFWAENSQGHLSPDGSLGIFDESSIKKTFKHLGQEKLRTPNAYFLTLLGTPRQRQTSARWAAMEAQMHCLELCHSAESRSCEQLLVYHQLRITHSSSVTPWSPGSCPASSSTPVHEHLQSLSLS